MIAQIQVEKDAAEKNEVEVFEARVAQVKLKEKHERIIAFFIPFLKAGLLTAAVLYIFNRIVLL